MGHRRSRNSLRQNRVNAPRHSRSRFTRRPPWESSDPEGVNDLARVAMAFLSTEGDISWQERLSQAGTQHPEYSRCAVVVEKLKGTRRERAQQFFNSCFVEKLVLTEPVTLEKGN
jgi:hypothetical protein